MRKLGLLALVSLILMGATIPISTSYVLIDQNIYLGDTVWSDTVKFSQGSGWLQSFLISTEMQVTVYLRGVRASDTTFFSYDTFLFQDTTGSAVAKFVKLDLPYADRYLFGVANDSITDTNRVKLVIMNCPWTR